MNTTPEICILNRFLYVMFASIKTASIDGFQREFHVLMIMTIVRLYETLSRHIRELHGIDPDLQD